MLACFPACFRDTPLSIYSSINPHARCIFVQGGLAFSSNAPSSLTRLPLLADAVKQSNATETHRTAPHRIAVARRDSPPSSCAFLLFGSFSREERGEARRGLLTCCCCCCCCCSRLSTAPLSQPTGRRAPFKIGDSYEYFNSNWQVLSN